MSTPFPLEDAAQLDRAQPVWNPWQGPAQPHWYSGVGFGDDTAHLGPFYVLGRAVASGAEKGASVLTGLWGKEYSFLGNIGQTLGVPGAKAASEEGELISSVSDTARQNAKALTPDPATTGLAAQTLHSLASGVTEYSIGALAGGPVAGAAAVGTTEAVSRFQDLKEQGVDSETARASAGLTGIAAGLGAFMPGGWGSSLLTRLATGAGANAGFGLANRYLDHKILEDGDYKEMADQQRVWDGTQLLTDTVLGAAFGGLAHLHAGKEETRVNATSSGRMAAREAPGLEDAALTANLALRDRAAAPGVATDPASAAAHQAALEEATASLLKGEPVDVSHTGVDRADFAARPAADVTAPEELLVNVLKESGILEEERNLQALEEALGRRMRREPEPVQTPAEPESVASETPPAEEGYTVGEQELTDEQRQAFERLAHPQDQVVPGTAEGGGREGEPGLENDGGRGSLGGSGQPARVYRGGRGGPLTPEHFSPETLGRATGHPSSGLGVFFTGDASDAARYGSVTEHDLTLRNPKHVPIEDLPGFDTLSEATAYREQLRSEGHDGMVIDASHLGGPKHYVVFDQSGVKPAEPDAATQPLAEHPGMALPDENGTVTPAADALRQADTAVAVGEQEAPKAIQAAVNCFLRKGA